MCPNFHGVSVVFFFFFGSVFIFKFQLDPKRTYRIEAPGSVRDDAYNVPIFRLLHHTKAAPKAEIAHNIKR
jgi:hypothetical protein